MIEADDLGPAQAARKPQKQDGPIAQSAQIMWQRADHGEDILRQDRLFLRGGAGMSAPDAGQNRGDMAVLAVQRKAALRIIPAKPRQPPLDRRHTQAARLSLRGGQIGKVKPDQFRGGRQRVRAAHPAPAAKLRPILRIGTLGVFRDCLPRIVACGFHEPVKRPGPCNIGRQRQIGAGRGAGLVGLWR